MAGCGPGIVRLAFNEVIVPARPGAIDGGLDKPLHMLPVAGLKPWSVQFDALPKLILRDDAVDGTVGWGEFYRDHNWTTVEGDFPQWLLGDEYRQPFSPEPRPFHRSASMTVLSARSGMPTPDTFHIPQSTGCSVAACGTKVKVGAWSSHRAALGAGRIAAAFQSSQVMTASSSNAI